MNTMFYVYIIYSQKIDRFYVGYTTNIEIRIHQYHNLGRSNYTSKGIPWELKHFEAFESEIEAMRREKQIKKLKSKKYILSLIEQSRPQSG